MLLYYKQIQCVSRTSQVHITRHAVDIKPPSEDSLYRSLSICCTIFYWNSCKLSIKCRRWIILWISGSHNVSLQRTKSQKCLHFYSLRILKCNENLAKKVQMRLSLHHPHNRNPSSVCTHKRHQQNSQSHIRGPTVKQWWRCFVSRMEGHPLLCSLNHVTQ